MLKVIFWILIGMLLILLLVFGELVINSNYKAEVKEVANTPKYHIQLIVPNTDEYFWILFREGAIAAQEEYEIFVEFIKVLQRNADELMKAVEMGANAGVNGIALQAADSELTGVMIEKAKEKGVKLLAYENDTFLIPNTPIVGTNTYSLGCIAGEMAIEATGGQANVAVILNNADVQYKNNIIQGILESFSKYMKININNNHIYTVNADLFESEKIASTIMEDSDKVDLIICFDERSTPGIAQILVDNNKVGDIQLIGYGAMPQTLDYIERGVIFGTVCPNAYEIGYHVVKQLVLSLDGEQISDYTSTELYTINRKNVNQYRLEIEQE